MNLYYSTPPSKSLEHLYKMMPHKEDMKLDNVCNIMPPVSFLLKQLV